MRVKTNIYIATLWQFAVSVMLLWLTRFVFVFYNADSVGNPGLLHTFLLALRGIPFDLSAAAYFNALFILMRIIPLDMVYRRAYLRATDIIFFVSNTVMLAVNLADVPYYRFTGSRLRWSNLINICTDPDITSIATGYLWQYLWIGVLIALAVSVLVVLYYRPVIVHKERSVRLRIVNFIVIGVIVFCMMRGRIGNGNPLSIGDAAFGLDNTREINVVLNSPFCILRSTNKTKSNIEPEMTFFESPCLSELRSTVHPAGRGMPVRNYVTIIIESGGAEWIDCLAVTPGASGRGLMPFVDSLARESLVLHDFFAGSRTSCCGATALTMGIPAFDPFYYMLSPYNSNTVDSPARLMKESGWSTVFYYGCKHGSFNIDQTAAAAGHARIVDRDTYGDDRDYDGHWGIFDIPMAEYVVQDLNATQQPFFATWFTISAHSPFSLPAGFDASVFKNQEPSPARGLEYTDMALRRFFTAASQQPWFANTTYIITADHGNRDFKGTAQDGDYIRNRIPLIIYTPDGLVKPAVITDRVASQHDMAATLLTLAGYDRPFVSIGADILDPDYHGYGIVRVDGGRYMVSGTRYTIYLSADMTRVESVYDTAHDPLMNETANDFDADIVADMQLWAQALMQDYTFRLNHDRLSIDTE